VPRFRQLQLEVIFMKKFVYAPLVLFLLMLLPSAATFAQHCPFDGYYMIVAHLTDAENKPVENAEINLREIDNPQAARCNLSKGLLNKKFTPVKTLLDDFFGTNLPTGNAVERFCADCQFLGAGFFAAIMPGSERNCMIYDDKNDLTFIKRKFEIHYGDQKSAVEPAQIYRLCWAEGEWSRIQPIEMRGK
jgi:hypothetical protein